MGDRGGGVHRSLEGDAAEERRSGREPAPGEKGAHLQLGVHAGLQPADELHDHLVVEHQRSVALLGGQPANGGDRREAVEVGPFGVEPESLQSARGGGDATLLANDAEEPAGRIVIEPLDDSRRAGPRLERERVPLGRATFAVGDLDGGEDQAGRDLRPIDVADRGDGSALPAEPPLLRQPSGEERHVDGKHLVSFFRSSNRTPARSCDTARASTWQPASPA